MELVDDSCCSRLSLNYPEFIPRAHFFSTHNNQHSIDTHRLEGSHTGLVQTHTCASESNVALVTSALKGVIVGLLARQPHSAEHGHTHSLHLAQHLCYSEMFFSLRHTGAKA